MDPLTIALAIYGGYQGYKSAKRANANTLGKLFATAAGAYGGYNLGSGINSLANVGADTAANTALTAGTNAGASAAANSAGIAALDTFGSSTAADIAANQAASAAANQVPLGGIMNYNPELASMGSDAVAGRFQQIQPLTDPYAGTSLSMGNNKYSPYQVSAGTAGGAGEGEPSLMKKAGDIAYNTFFDDKGGVKVGNAALVGVPAALYASGAFEREPYQRNMFTYNVNYPDLYRNRKFYTQDPESGEVKELEQQAYIPEEKAREGITPDQQFGPYRREVLTLRQGGLASLAHFKDGGVTYLPSKAYADETDEDSYMRANGYVEDSTGSGNKDEDTMLAQLADGEFVTRTDGVLGAGILAGANPSDPKQMRKMGADFFYEQQKRFKRIFDLLDASRKATAH
jgi:hypothetical protein